MLKRIATSDNKKGITAGSLTSKPKFVSKKNPNKKEGSEEKIPRAFQKACKYHNKVMIIRKKQRNPLDSGNCADINPKGKKQGDQIGKITIEAAPFGLYAGNKDALVKTQMKYNPTGEVTREASPSRLIQRKHKPFGNVTKTATPSKLCSRNCRSLEA